MSLHGRVQELLGAKVAREEVLTGGSIADVRRLTLSDGRDVVAKVGHDLALEVSC